MNLAVYDCQGDCAVLPVGSAPDGRGRWGHMDLAGSLDEWVLDYYDADWYSDVAAQGTDIAQLDGPASSASWLTRGGDFYYAASRLRASDRAVALPDDSWIIGVRCARDP
jgi:formylglycine-generating enzyme required for sulfatase activity